MLTILVPIGTGDYTVVTELPSLASADENTIYKFEGYYRRKQSYIDANGVKRWHFAFVIDREFPELGKPFNIVNFIYDATRMGTAPTITADSAAWDADKDSNGDDILLENQWNQECHVIFNGENYYLKQIPTSSKSNEDARYLYDLEFVSERVVLEHVYIYDVVQPFVSERPISESSKFSFFGPITELVSRINASLISSGVSSLVRKYVAYPALPGDQFTSNVRYLTYAQWNLVGKEFDAVAMTDSGLFHDTDEANHFWNLYYILNGNYTRYLQEYIFENTDGEYTIKGYKVVLGKDAKGNEVTSEEKLIAFENNYIHDALQKIKDDYELQYFIYQETDSNGDFTGNTIIEVADCQHDFADLNQAGTDFIRDNDGLPTTTHPFSYGVDNELLSIQKENKTEKIVTSITGHGSEENIPWYYPNPTADGWIKPLYMRNGEALDVDIDYPKSEGDNAAAHTRYEKYLKNRLGNVIQFGHRYINLSAKEYSVRYGNSSSSFDSNETVLWYEFTITDNTKVKVGCQCILTGATLSYELYKDGTQVTSSDYDVFINGGSIALAAGTYNLKIVISYTEAPIDVVGSITKYCYPHKVALCTFGKTWEWWQAALLPVTLTLMLFSGDLRNGWYVDFPSFLSTNGNLKFKETGSAKTSGWYDGDRKIAVSEMEIPIKNDKIRAYVPGQGHYPFADYLFNKEGAVNFPEYVGRNLNNWDDSVGYLWDVVSNNQFYTPAYEEPIVLQYNELLSVFIEKYFTYSIQAYNVDGWYIKNKKINLSDYGIDGESTLTTNATIYDTIEFQRVKYVTPQQYLMPEVYIKTDGERRHYNAKNYPATGAADAAIGEYKEGNIVKNDLFKNEENNYYEFENTNIKARPHEHIEDFDDIKASIKEQTITIGSSELRIDVIEEFGYDALDSDEIWENNDEGGTAGEYKHPHFFAKLRPLGFNLFDLALETDMVLSLTTGSCGSCNFKIKVDENTKKNPVQIWPYDVYGGSTYATKGDLIYAAGSLRRYVDTSNLYYDTNGQQSGYTLVDNMSRLKWDIITGNINRFERTTYTAKQVINGFVGSLKKDSKTHIEGDVMTSGKFIDSQQDTTSNYVWIALEKDTDTFGMLMPAARPNYADTNFNVYIEPKAIHHTNRNTGISSVLTEEQADKFVLTNIRMPQIYLRNAEKKLSKELIKYMYENNYQKFNFSIKFSRIFLAQNEDIERLLNENSVLYVKYNRNHIYRQYVSHYTYKVVDTEALPEITVDMNEELSVVRSMSENEELVQAKNRRNIIEKMSRQMRAAISNSERRLVSKSDDVILSGNVVSRDSVVSFASLRESSDNSENGMTTNLHNLNVLTAEVNTFNSAIAGNLAQIRQTVEARLMPFAANIVTEETCTGNAKYRYNIAGFSDTQAKFWLDSDGEPLEITSGSCPSNQGMIDVTWTDINFQ